MNPVNEVIALVMIGCDASTRLYAAQAPAWAPPPVAPMMGEEESHPKRYGQKQRGPKSQTR